MDKGTTKYDVAIIGGGPAGYTAAIYAQRAGRRVVLFEKGSPGGQMGITSEIENYPGFESIDGFTLAMKMREQAKKTGTEIISSGVVSAKLSGSEKKILTGKEEFTARSVIIATGAKPKLLGVSGEREYTGKGVSYCATCDGMFFKKKVVVVNGGGETAIEDALYLANICEKVIVVHRRDKFRASKYAVDKAENRENIEFRLNATVREITGDGVRVSGVRIVYTDGKEETVDAAGIFVAIGREADTEIFAEQVETDGGYIVAGEDCRTSVGGVFAAGDVRTKKLRQIVTAASDGAIAARSADEWLIMNE